ncbi:putative Histidine-containing phosphotransfer protein [Melia azedarach]|nr:putative Histidine-containing phosphotransfer protein [Melia azedarach]
MNLFYVDTDKVVEEMNGYLSQQNYEFGREFDFCIHQLYGSTATIGAQRLNVICEQLREAAEEKSRERVVEALNTFTHEYCVFQNKFRTLQQLEKGNVYGNGFHSTETG